MTIIAFPQAADLPEDALSVNTLLLSIAPRAVYQSRSGTAGPTPRALLPAEALELLSHSLDSVNQVLLQGPGDPLATIDNTLETVERIHGQYPQVGIEMTTMGLDGAQFAVHLNDAGLSSVNVQVQAVKEEKIEAYYAWVRPGKKNIPLKKIAATLPEMQAEAIEAFLEVGLDVTVHTSCKGLEETENIASIASWAAGIGVSQMHIVIEAEACCQHHLQSFESAATAHLPQVRVERKQPATSDEIAERQTLSLPKPKPEKPNVAVVSSSGMDIDAHLGQAATLLIYGPRDDGLTCLLETRQAPAKGGGDSRWQMLADLLDDCFVLLCAGAGEKPQSVLRANGVEVIVTEEGIDGSVDQLYGGGKKKGCKSKR